MTERRRTAPWARTARGCGGLDRPFPLSDRHLRLALAAFLPLLSACGELDYYLHLARGQGRILLASQAVGEVLAEPATPLEVRAALERVDELCRFGREGVGLTASQGYTRYFDTGGGPVAWNVSASPPHRFEPFLWWFPVVGELPYKGYFDVDHARAERDRLRSEGYDAIVRSVSAYSTLGYLEDPVLSTMVGYSEDRLAELILHELTHSDIYAEGHADYNENAATFVGRVGTLKYLTERYGADSDEVRRSRRRQREADRFTAFVQKVAARLDSLYSAGDSLDQVLRKRRDLFRQAKGDYRRNRGDFGPRYDGFLDWEPNNAMLLSYRRYHSRQGDFEAVLARFQGDLPATVAALAACAHTGDPWSCVQQSQVP